MKAKDECRRQFEEWASTVPFTHGNLHYDCDAWIGWQAAWKPVLSVGQMMDIYSKPHNDAMINSYCFDKAHRAGIEAIHTTMKGNK